MSGRSLYDDDIHAWAEQQAGALRRWADNARAIPNELDLEHVVEEIEDVGIAQRTAAESFIRQIFVHLIKLRASLNSEPADHWRAEIVTFHNELLQRLTPSMHGRIDLDKLWRRALKEASAKIAAEPNEKATLLATLKGPPLSIDDLAGEDLDIEAALSGLGLFEGE